MKKSELFEGLKKWKAVYPEKVETVTDKELEQFLLQETEKETIQNEKKSVDRFFLKQYNDIRIESLSSAVL